VFAFRDISIRVLYHFYLQLFRRADFQKKGNRALPTTLRNKDNTGDSILIPPIGTLLAVVRSTRRLSILALLWRVLVIARIALLRSTSILITVTLLWRRLLLSISWLHTIPSGRALIRILLLLRRIIASCITKGRDVG